MLNMTFSGSEYHSTNTTPCAFCSKETAWLNRPWVLREENSGRKIYVCGRHYEHWQAKRDKALIWVTEEFIAALADLDE